MATAKQVIEARAEGYQQGYNKGYQEGIAKGKQILVSDQRALLLDAQTKLISAVGQTLHGLAAAFDTGPR